MVATSKNGFFISLLTLSLLLSGCATLPSNGPTLSQFTHDAKSGDVQGFHIMDITSDKVAELNKPYAPTPESQMEEMAARQSLDRLGPGDVLQIVIFETGVNVFGGTGGNAGAALASNFGTHEEKFPNIVVNENGNIYLPFIGRISVTGMSTHMLEQAVERELRGKSESPHVLITVLDSERNSVYITGSIRKPGRIKLNPSHIHLLDVLAESGGTEEQPYNIVVRLTRRGQARAARLSDIYAGESKNLEMLPGDRLEFIRRTISFTALGAAQRSAEIPFDTDHLSFAQALGKMSGLNDNQANPRAVFLFRNNPDAPANNRAIIYRLNMIEPKSFIIAQKLLIKDKDLIYVANAKANAPLKLIGAINQLFTPVVTAKAVGLF